MSEKLATQMPTRTPEEIDEDFRQWEAENAAPPDTEGTPLDSAEAVPILPDIAPRPESVEQKAELDALPDAAIRYTDVELLGKRYPVRHALREMGNQRVKAAEGLEAKLRNTIDTPGKLRRKFSASLAESRYSRQKARVDTLSHLPDSHYLKRRHLAKLARSEGKLNRANSSLEAHTTIMESRKTAVHENAENRREAYVKELLGRREAALARKTLRHELRASGAGRFEARALLKEIPEAHVKRVGRVAAQAETSRRAFGQAEREKTKAAKQETKVLSDIDNNEKLIARYKLESDDAQKTLAELTGTGNAESSAENSLPHKEQHVSELQKQLESLAEDDPDRTSLQIQIDEAQHAVDIIKDREIPYWKSVAEKSAQRAKMLEYERIKFRNRLENAQNAKTTVASAAEQQRQVLHDDLTTRRTAAQTVINNEGNN